MRVIPVLIDDRPDYLAGQPDSSLLLMPLGTSTVYASLRGEVAHYSRNRIVVVTRFEPEPEYAGAIASLGVRAQEVLTAAGFQRFLARLEPSDWLLIRDSRCIGLEPLDLRCVLEDSPSSARSARHFICPAGTAGGTDERVLLDAAGRVSRIQRYYEPVTWPFASAVACSLVPVAAAVGLRELAVTCPAGLRASLAAASVPSQDFFLDKPFFDPGTEAGLLDITEALLSTSAPGTLPRAADASVHTSAVVRGAVVMGRAVVVESHATIIGPSVLGCGSRVGHDAVVAQCVIAPGASVPPATVVRHRVITRGFKTLRASAASTEPAMGEGPAVREPRPEPLVRDGLKRPLDVLLSLAGLVVLLPLLAVVALLIRLDSRGRVLFSDLREGRRGRVFPCFKFRTMVTDADVAQQELASASQVDGPQFKIDQDPRVTRLGGWLRRLNIDELPQLLNVVRGEMSLVGPRPSPFRENQVCVPWRDARLSVRPGITGLWQICREDRSSGDFHQWIYYDLLYVHNMSLYLDLKILLATALSLGGRFRVPVSRMLAPAKLHERRRLPRPPEGPDLTHLRRSA